MGMFYPFFQTFWGDLCSEFPQLFKKHFSKFPFEFHLQKGLWRPLPQIRWDGEWTAL